jgi:hypothetical protein
MTIKAARRQAIPRRSSAAVRAFGNGLRMSRWWDRNGWNTPLVRVLCYVRGRRRAYLWRATYGRRSAVHVMFEVGGTHSYGSWCAAFAAARAHVGAAVCGDSCRTDRRRAS